MQSLQLTLILLVLTVAVSVTASMANAQVIIFNEQSDILPNNALSLYVSFSNYTNATLLNESISEEQEIITKGCFEGLGYHKDGPYKCYPLDSIGEDPPPGTMYCAALGCPYNPPDPDNPTPGEIEQPPEDAEGPEPEPEPEPEPTREPEEPEEPGDDDNDEPTNGENSNDDNDNEDDDDEE